MSLSHIKAYIGSHVDTDDYNFQEQMRTFDLAIQEKLKKIVGEERAKLVFGNGWGQIFSAAYILAKNPLQLKISEAFKKFLIEKLEGTFSKCSSSVDPLTNMNVRGFTKPVMMYPHPEQYFPFQKVTLEKPIEYLNKFIKEANLEFSLYEGKLYLKINPEDESNIFNKLWKTDFAELLSENGYTNMEKNKECAHVTLINSDVIAKIKEGFNNKHKLDGQEKFECFMKEMISSFNEKLKKLEERLSFTELCSAYSEDYSPFEEVIVAKLEASFVETALTILVKTIQEELDIQIAVKPKSSFHLTIAIKYRQPSSLISENIEDILSKTGKYSESLKLYWQQFIKI